jgi:hypothetical protein
MIWLSAQQFIDNDISQLNVADGIFENIGDSKSANDYLRHLLKDAKKEIRLLLSQMGILYMLRNRDVYNLLEKQNNLIRIL